jgi:hypothetical protein
MLQVKRLIAVRCAMSKPLLQNGFTAAVAGKLTGKALLGMATAT